jgi:hypothetical protein
VLPVHHRDLLWVRPKVASLTGENLEEGLLELPRFQAVTASPSGEHLEEKG